MEKEYVGYLFCFFTGNEETLDDEQVYFSVSRDGLHWKDLNNRKPVLHSTIGTGGARDPFIIRLEKEKRYVIMATDLHIARGTAWEEAVSNGSTNIICWESSDLVNWSSPYFFETGMNDAGCAWAPEAIYDEKTSDYLVYWSSYKKDAGDKKHKIYCCSTKDFHHFSRPGLYIEKETDVIDTTIIRHAGKFFRFVKDEVSGKIFLEKGNGLKTGSYMRIDAPALEVLEGVEGPAIFQFNDRQRWCLLLDRFKEQKGYFPLISEDLENGEFQELSDTDYDFGVLKKRHGSILKLTKEEWDRLRKYY